MTKLVQYAKSDESKSVQIFSTDFNESEYPTKLYYGYFNDFIDINNDMLYMLLVEHIFKNCEYEDIMIVPVTTLTNSFIESSYESEGYKYTSWNENVVNMHIKEYEDFTTYLNVILNSINVHVNDQTNDFISYNIKMYEDDNFLKLEIFLEDNMFSSEHLMSTITVNKNNMQFAFKCMNRILKCLFTRYGTNKLVTILNQTYSYSEVASSLNNLVMNGYANSIHLTNDYYTENINMFALSSHNYAQVFYQV